MGGREMEEYYTKDDGGFDGPCKDFPPIEKTEVTMFHVGQSYALTPVPTFRCKGCGGVEFNVGQAEYATAIRCVK